MTSSLRRKRPTTVRPITPARILTSLAALGWLAGAAHAQPSPTALKPFPSVSDLPPPVTPRPMPQTLYFQKDAVPPPVPAAKPAPAPPAARPAAPAPAPAQPVRAPVIQARVQVQDPDTGEGQFKLPPSVVRAIERASLKGEKGLPTNEELFSLRSEQQIQKSVVDEAGMQGFYGKFPEDYESLSKEPFPGRHFDPHTLRVEPNFVCHHRLYFEELNSERYGWDLGPIQPFVSTGYFIKDMFLLPYHFGTRPCQRYDTSAAQCLPGDPVPYLLYPFEISLTGALLEAGVVVGGYAVLP